MKRIESTISYVVPGWNFCNSDNLDKYGQVTKKRCNFCIKEKQGYRCALYDTGLSTYNELIEKTKACCKATAGFNSRVVVENVPDKEYIMPPKELVKQAVDSYNKKLNELLTQGYPRQIAEMAAKKFTLGE